VDLVILRYIPAIPWIPFVAYSSICDISVQNIINSDPGETTFLVDEYCLEGANFFPADIPFVKVISLISFGLSFIVGHLVLSFLTFHEWFLQAFLPLQLSAQETLCLRVVRVCVRACIAGFRYHDNL